MHDAATLDEFAFAMGALAHYAADTAGHSVAINRVVPILYPKLKKKYGPEVTYADSPGRISNRICFDVLQIAKGRYASDAYHDFIGFEFSGPSSKELFSRPMASN